MLGMCRKCNVRTFFTPTVTNAKWYAAHAKIRNNSLPNPNTFNVARTPRPLRARLLYVRAPSERNSLPNPCKMMCSTCRSHKSPQRDLSMRYVCSTCQVRQKFTPQPVLHVARDVLSPDEIHSRIPASLCSTCQVRNIFTPRSGM